MSRTAEQLLLDLGHRASLAAEDFLEAPSNREALAWIARWPDWPAPALVLHGPAGAGKTHLARIFAARADAVRLDASALPAEDAATPAAAVLDPAEPVADEAALLRLYNRVRERGGHLLLTATRPAAHWRLALPDLASRLRAAPSVAIGPPDDALLAALLVKLFADRQLRVGEGVVAWLVRHMERSFAAAHAVVGRLDALALQQKRPVTVALARAVLEDLDPPPDREAS